mmetsp:Transcript_62321/g.157540  ORF Transcript_62321/g.157540 Transcript_62321/m.157540 type:complete len:225 (-) Transcript_62321:1416-2090(-)
MRMWLKQVCAVGSASESGPCLPIVSFASGDPNPLGGARDEPVQNTSNDRFSSSAKSSSTISQNHETCGESLSKPSWYSVFFFKASKSSVSEPQISNSNSAARKRDKKKFCPDASHTTLLLSFTSSGCMQRMKPFLKLRNLSNTLLLKNQSTYNSTNSARFSFVTGIFSPFSLSGTWISPPNCSYDATKSRQKVSCTFPSNSKSCSSERPISGETSSKSSIVNFA